MHTCICISYLSEHLIIPSNRSLSLSRYIYIYMHIPSIRVFNHSFQQTFVLLFSVTIVPSFVTFLLSSVTMLIKLQYFFFPRKKTVFLFEINKNTILRCSRHSPKRMYTMYQEIEKQAVDLTVPCTDILQVQKEFRN